MLRNLRFVLLGLSLLAGGCLFGEADRVPPLEVSAPLEKAETEELTEREAVELAETFIVRNGYTDLPPDEKNLSHESIEWSSNTSDLLANRRDSLYAKAYGISRRRKNGSRGWTVVFKYRLPSGKEMRKNGRAVTMNLDGSEPRVEHVDFILAMVEKVL